MTGERRPTPDSFNDDLPPTRPGYIVYIGAIIVVVGVIAIMLFNKGA
jgi:hypothetical protein